MSAMRQALDDVLEVLVPRVREHGLVVFTGAGLSMPGPSALPGWRDLNTAFLQSLCLHLAVFTDSDVGPGLLEWLVERRDERQLISPDFQAQLAEDECGADYFRMLQVLDIEAFNPGHAVLAELTRSGHMRAIVTTNFDRLIEHALIKADVAFRVFSTVADFEVLEQLIAADALPTNVIPVVKAHGSVEDSTSMVDTLRQRVTGRPVALEKAIAALLGSHVALVIGFSGADLADRPNYLGLAEGARRSPLFVVMNQTGQQPMPVMTELCGKAGANGCIVDGELPADLERLHRELGGGATLLLPAWDGEMSMPGIRSAMLPSAVSGRWADSLDPISAANILATLVEAAGADTYAVQLLLATWPRIANPQERRDPVFLRFLKLLGHHLIEHALLGPSASPLDATNPKTGATAFQLLTFAGADREHPDAIAHAARAVFYTGAVGKAVDLAILACERMGGVRPQNAIDAWLAAGSVLRMARESEKALPWLERAYALAHETGDERLRARVCAEFARCLATLDRCDEAEARLDEGFKAADRLQHVQLVIDISAARGAVALQRLRIDDAMRELTHAARCYAKTMRITRYAESLLHLLSAARHASDPNAVEFAIGELQPLIPRLPALEIEFRLWYAAAYVDAGQLEQAHQAIEYVRIAAQVMDNRGALNAVDRLASQLSDAQRSAGG